MEFTKTKYNHNKFLMEYKPDGSVIKKEKDENYIRLPKNWLLKLENVSPAQRLILIVLKSYRGRNGLIYPSFMTISKASGYSRRQVINIINELRNKKLILTERKGRTLHFKIVI